MNIPMNECFAVGFGIPPATDDEIHRFHTPVYLM
jgi:hypothetical protein